MTTKLSLREGLCLVTAPAPISWACSVICILICILYIRKVSEDDDDDDSDEEIKRSKMVI